ncbi:MAG TPA: ABC transporter substrate-binding protein [Alphaproteobacteria bacterium]|nr:ABC transporter substrate-binding protein [Alphaproteobacteria bacterium]
MGQAEVENFVKTVGERVISLAGAYHQRHDARHRAALEALLRKSFDLDGGTRFVLGRHWSEATAAQRRELMSLLPNYALEVATRTLSSFKVNEVRNFIVVGSRPAGDTDRLVETSVQLGDGQPFVVGWRVREVDGEPKVVDAFVQGVSMAVTIRDAVDSVIARQGIDGLIAEVQAKLTQLQASK